MNAHLVSVVANREMSTRLRDRTFLLSTAVLLILVGASVVIPLVLNRGADRPSYTLAVVGPDATATGQLARCALSPS